MIYGKNFKIWNNKLWYLEHCIPINSKKEIKIVVKKCEDCEKNIRLFWLIILNIITRRNIEKNFKYNDKYFCADNIKNKILYQQNNETNVLEKKRIY
jgi:hypothetical protein